MMKIFHNPRCKKSRAGLNYLKEKTSEIKIRTYLKEEMTTEEMKEILLKMNVSPVDLVRTQEAYYKSDLKGKNFTDEEWIKIMLENPKLIKRPIVVSDTKAIWGDPPEEIDRLF